MHVPSPSQLPSLLCSSFFVVDLFSIFISYFVPCFLCLFLLFYVLLNFLIPPPCLLVSFSFSIGGQTKTLFANFALFLSIWMLLVKSHQQLTGIQNKIPLLTLITSYADNDNFTECKLQKLKNNFLRDKN